MVCATMRMHGEIYTDDNGHSLQYPLDEIVSDLQCNNYSLFVSFVKACYRNLKECIDGHLTNSEKLQANSSL